MGDFKKSRSSARNYPFDLETTAGRLNVFVPGKGSGDYSSNQFKTSFYPYDTNLSKTMSRIIDSMITDNMSASGKIIKFLFDEYQKGVIISDLYTGFYINYVIGDDKHVPISDNNIYTLSINDWGELIPVRIFKKFDIDNILKNNNNVSVDTNTEDKETHNPDLEIYSRRLASWMINLYSSEKDQWDSEIHDGCHDWKADMHSSLLDRARQILTGEEDE